jgi:pimeloyl-ACP methyl ester carboxylesterase
MQNILSDSTQTRVNSGDVSLAVYEWGNPDNTAIVFIHGYPDCSRVWHPVISELAPDYHCIAYDVRGAGESSVPKGISAWSVANLSSDLQAVINAKSPDRPVHLVAHDWGSIQTWESVTDPKLQTRISSYTTISGPYLDHVGMLFRSQLKSGKLASVASQVFHSWYIALFHLPLLGPSSWQMGLDKKWPAILNKIEGVQEAEPNPSQRKDGRFGVNLYRANVLKALLKPRERHTTVPIQLIVPSGDNYVTANLFDELTKWAPKLWRRDLDAKHWVPLSHAVELAKWIKEFDKFLANGQQDDVINRLKVER